MNTVTARLIPNSTQIPNIILDEWQPVLTPAEFQVVMVIARQTYGWHKDTDRISYSQLIEKTAYKTDAIVAAIRALRESGKIIVTDSRGTQLKTKEECRGKTLYYQLNFTDLSEIPSGTSRKNRDTKENININSNELIQRNADVDRILLDFSLATGLKRPSDKKERQWAYLWVKNKPKEHFLPCLKYLLKLWPNVTISKIETIYRNFPVYERDVLAVKRSRSNFQVVWDEEGPLVVYDQPNSV